MEQMRPDDEVLPLVERTVELAVPADELWRHLVDGELASLWMGVDDHRATFERSRHAQYR